MTKRWSDETEQLVAEALWAACFVAPRGSGMTMIGQPSETCREDARSALTALADAGLLMPASANEIDVYPSYLAADNIRVNIEHPEGSCRWGVAFAAQPTNRVQLAHLIQEIHRHDASCIAKEDES